MSRRRSSSGCRGAFRVGPVGSLQGRSIRAWANLSSLSAGGSGEATARRDQLPAGRPGARLVQGPCEARDQAAPVRPVSRRKITPPWRTAPQQGRDAASPLVGGVDRQRVGGTDADPAPGEVMDEVQDLAEGAADPVRVCTASRRRAGRRRASSAGPHGWSSRQSSCRRGSGHPGCPGHRARELALQGLLGGVARPYRAGTRAAPTRYFPHAADRTGNRLRTRA